MFINSLPSWKGSIMKKIFVFMAMFLMIMHFGFTGGEEITEPTVVESMQMPHWHLTRAGVTFDLSEKNIRVESGRNEKIFVEVKKVELDERETPLVSFEVGATNSSVTVGSFGGSVQSQALVNQTLHLGNTISLNILSYLEHVGGESDKVIARLASKLKNKEIKAPAPKIIHKEKIKLM